MEAQSHHIMYCPWPHLNLMISQRPYLQTPSQEKQVGLQLMHFGETQVQPMTDWKLLVYGICLPLTSCSGLTSWLNHWPLQFCLPKNPSGRFKRFPLQEFKNFLYIITCCFFLLSPSDSRSWVSSHLPGGDTSWCTPTTPLACSLTLRETTLPGIWNVSGAEHKGASVSQRHPQK